jgi:hypothetical protein
MEKEEQSEKHYPVRQSALMAGGTALTAGLIDVAMNMGSTGLLVGGIASYLAWRHGPELYERVKTLLPAASSQKEDDIPTTEIRAPGRRTLADRLLGPPASPMTPEAFDEQEPEEGATQPLPFETAIDAEGNVLNGELDSLNLGPTLQPHADRLLSGRKVILGVSGSGKTNTMNVYCEELGKLDPAPAMIIFDTDDENRALCNKKYFPNPQWLEKSRRLTTGNAFQAAQTILEQGYQCVVNLQSYGEEEAAWIMIKMLQGVRAWEEAHTVRIPCEIILDEASSWLPQNPRESLLSSLTLDDPDAVGGEEGRKISLLALLQRAFFTVVRRGRRRGMGLTLAAQRIAELDKRALQGSWMFLMRQTQPADWREYQKFGISAQEAMALLDGEAYVIEPDKPKRKHRLRQSTCPHGGITPGMKALRSARPKPTETALALTTAAQVAALPSQESQTENLQGDMALQTLVSALTQAQGIDEQMVQTLIDALPALRTQPAAVQLAQPTNPPALAQQTSGWHTSNRMNAALQAAYNAYQPGMSHHTLAQRLVTSPRVAGQLLRQLVQRGSIDSATGKLVSAPVSLSQPQVLQDPEESKAIAIWNGLAPLQRNVRAFAEAAGLGDTKAWELLTKLEKAGLIQWERRKKKSVV